MKKKWIAIAGYSCAFLCLILLVGCGGERPPVASSSGTVMLDGKPVEGVKVMFHPIDGGARFSYGVTDDNGKFRLSTFGMNDGALIGRHKVAVVKVDTSTQETFDPKELSETGYGGDGYKNMMGIGKGTKPAKTKHLIPEKYSNHETSGIEVEVVAGSNDFPLNL